MFLFSSMFRQNTNIGLYSHCGVTIVHYQGIWCGGATDSTPWIRVNFNAKVYITGLITQGWVNNIFYVITFYIKYGDILSSLTYVTTSGGNMQLVSTLKWAILILV